MNATSRLHFTPLSSGVVYRIERNAIASRSHVSIASIPLSRAPWRVGACKTIFALAKTLSFSALLLSANAQATSFDCAKARSFSEHAACNDPNLGALDDTLANAYLRAYQIAPNRRALAADRDAQWHWRQIHCQNTECVSSWYRRRIWELDATGQHRSSIDEAEMPAVMGSAVHSDALSAKTYQAARHNKNIAPLAGPSFSGQDQTAAATSQIADGKAPKKSANPPLPSDAEMEQTGVSELDVASIIPAIHDVGAAVSRHLAEPEWPALPPLPQSGSPNFGIVSKGDGPTKRTIGFQLGF